MGIIWSVLWLILIHDTPAKHPRIDTREREYIERSQGLLASTQVSRPSLHTDTRSLLRGGFSRAFPSPLHTLPLPLPSPLSSPNSPLPFHPASRFPQGGEQET